MESTATAASIGGLIPSQVVGAQPSVQATSTSNQNGGRGRRRKNKKKENRNTSNDTEGKINKASTNNNGNISDGKEDNSGAKKTKKPPPKSNPNQSHRKQQPENDVKKPKPKRRNKKSTKKKKSPEAWWKSHIPSEAVDPITLDPLTSLSYPPFALVASEPYEPVVWPPASEKTPPHSQNEETAEERERRLLAEQWGDVVAKTTSTTTTQAENRPVNLFDGRALAYYMVSQLQFIDPLNRRDVTREEIVHLDSYLQTIGGGKQQSWNVIEAFDGTVLSTAGATAQTAAGRARLLQHEASTLLHALFRGTPGAATTTSNATNSSMAQQFAQQEGQRGATSTRPTGQEDDTGIYGSDPSFMIIDDDLNPGLRGRTANLRPDAPQFVPQPPPELFPTLVPPPAPLSTTTTTTTTKLPKTKTLSKIKNLVQKTDPQEKQRQWEAREANLRRAALSNLRFGGTPSLAGYGSTTTPPPLLENMEPFLPSQGQLERNKNLADALGVGSMTNVAPVAVGDQQQQQSLGDPLQQPAPGVVYPETLLTAARDTIRTDFIIRLERKWRNFVQDPKAVSLSLPPMDRTHRKFVHEYSDHWNFTTESFDPQPKRYIHCTKQFDSHIPRPLLSIAKQSKTVRTTSALSLSGAPALSAEDAVNTRLLPSRERPKLALAKRTLPLPPGSGGEMMPATTTAAVVVEDDENEETTHQHQQRLQERKERKLQQQVRARLALESAFASDDDDEDSDSSLSWGEAQQEVYTAESDDESE